MTRIATESHRSVDNLLTGGGALHLIPRMSLLRSVLSVVSPLVLAAATLSAGCTTPYKSIACATATDCPTQEQLGHDVYDGGDSAPPLSECCAGLCVLQSSGCDSGYRLISKHDSTIDVSVCAPVSLMCSVELGDMAQ
jgi:hypothetical protein